MTNDPKNAVPAHVDPEKTEPTTLPASAFPNPFDEDDDEPTLVRKVNTDFSDDEKTVIPTGD